jgi:putative transposase
MHQKCMIDRFSPTTKICNVCDSIVNLSLSDRSWECSSCQTKHDRDLNASLNIKKLGHQLLKERKSDTLLECIPC